MGCVSSRILAKSGSFQEKASLGQHSFQRSSVIEEIILSSSKSNGDQFLALLCTSNSSASRKAKEPQLPSPAAAVAAEPAAKIETIDVSELLAGLEEEGSCAAEQRQGQQERQSCSRDGGDGSSSAPCCAAEAGRARSFRTVEELDAMLLTRRPMQSGSSPGQATALADGQEELPATASATAAATASAAEAEAAELGGSSEAAAAGVKRRARARQLGELKVPAAFDFSKSGSLRDWLRQGGQIFSPGSYVTPKFGTAPSPAAAEHGGVGDGEQQQEEDEALFDPELVAQFERAMEQLSEDEGRVLDEILEALESEAAGEKAFSFSLGRVSGAQAAEDVAAVAVQQL